MRKWARFSQAFNSLWNTKKAAVTLTFPWLVWNRRGGSDVCVSYLVLLLPRLKQLHENVALLHQLWVHALGLGERQDGLQGALSLTGGPQTATGGGKAIVDQPLLVLNHFLKDRCLTLHPVEVVSHNDNGVLQINHPRAFVLFQRLCDRA